jgi:hypothetical protein
MKKHCFVISPIGEIDSDIRKRSDQVFKHIISPAAEQYGYGTIRADLISEPGLITTQVIQHIIEDSLVVADLSGRNPNVYYELALRHAIKKPLIQLISKGEPLPFDVAGMRTIIIDHHDLDNVEESKEEIGRQIKALESNPDLIDNPISFAMNLKALRESDNPEKRTLADLISSMTQLRSDVSGVVTRLNDPSTLLPISYFKDILRSIEPVSREDMTSMDEMAYSISRLSSLVANSDLRQEPDHSQAVNILKDLQELLSRWSNRYMRQ